MKITKKQIKRIIREFYSVDVENYLRANAAEYHKDPSLDFASIKMLLMDDFMDNVGYSEDPSQYEQLINQLAAGEDIRESLLKETPVGAFENWEAIRDSIAHQLWELGTISGMELVSAVQGGYNWASPPAQNDIFSVLDQMLEEDEVDFDVEEDEWSLSDRGNYYDYMKGFKS